MPRRFETSGWLRVALLCIAEGCTARPNPGAQGPTARPPEGLRGPSTPVSAVVRADAAAAPGSDSAVPTDAAAVSPRVPASSRRCRWPAPHARARVATHAGTPPCPPFPAKTEQLVRASLERAVRADDKSAGLRVSVTFDCSPLGHALPRVWALRVFGHGASAALLGLERTASGAYRAEGMRVAAKSDGTASTELLASDLAVGNADETLRRIEASLMAKTTVDLGKTAGDSLRARPIAISSGNLFEAVHLEDADGLALERAWNGYPGTDQPDRLVVDFAFEQLEKAVPQRFTVREATAEDRVFFTDVWLSVETPWFADVPLLAFAESVGTPAVLPRVVARLDATKSDVQARAIRAIAAVTGWDARTGPDGGTRPQAEVAADYRRECGADDEP